MKRAELEREAKFWEKIHGVRPARIILSPTAGMKVLRWLPAACFDSADKLYGMKLYVREQSQPVLFEHESATPNAEPLAGALGIADATSPTDVLRRVLIVLHESGSHPRLQGALAMYLVNRVPDSDPPSARERIVQL
jgi:hypothetical protein